jgi:hypothetical protein
MNYEQRKQLDTEWSQCAAKSMAVDGVEAFWQAMERAAQIEREIEAWEKE